MKFRFWAATAAAAAAAFLSSDTLRVFEVENHSFFNPWSTQVNLFILGCSGLKTVTIASGYKKKTTTQKPKQLQTNGDEASLVSSPSTEVSFISGNVLLAFICWAPWWKQTLWIQLWNGLPV